MSAEHKEAHTAALHEIHDSHAEESKAAMAAARTEHADAMAAAAAEHRAEMNACWEEQVQALDVAERGWQSEMAQSLQQKEEEHRLATQTMMIIML